MKYRIWRFSFMCLLLVFCNYEGAYAGEFGPLRGKIVDAETKEPIEGVVVLVEWREIPLFGGSIFIDAQETLTDKDGNFTIPGIWVLNPWKRSGTDTDMTIYKSGYAAINTGAIRNWKQINTRLPYVLKLDENGNPVILLQRWKPEERDKYFDPSIPFVPDEKYHQLKWKWKLLRQEINKDRRLRGLDELIDADGFGR